MPKSTEKSRVLRELLETAIDLKAHGLLSKPEMARMNALCEELLRPRLRLLLAPRL